MPKLAVKKSASRKNGGKVLTVRNVKRKTLTKVNSTQIRTRFNLVDSSSNINVNSIIVNNSSSSVSYRKRVCVLRSQHNPNFPVFLRIYRKTVSNLKNREKILSSLPSFYEVGPTLIWTETSDDLSIFTTEESYTNFIGFEAPFNNPRSPKYLKKILLSTSMRMKKGSILIKEATPENTTRVPVHFCAYRIDANGVLSIFDPSWHSADPGIYSTTAFYDSLDAFGISYVHAESTRTHHWQSIIPFDDYCQTWTLKWLTYDTLATFPLPNTQKDARTQISSYMAGFTQIVLSDMDGFMSNLPTYKLEGNDPIDVFDTILKNPQTILNML